MPIEMVERVLGKNGIILWKKANGIDHSAVEAYSERKSISSETTFEQDTINIPMINDLLLKMVEKLSFQLKDQEES
jgi:DNA polymerase IV